MARPRREGLSEVLIPVSSGGSSHCEQDRSTAIFLSTLLLTPIGPDDLPLIALAQTSPVLEP